MKLPPNGDIVVGQEYTDFDKGLDDGIEGDIYGFNFILSPAIQTRKTSITDSKQNLILAERRHLFAPGFNYKAHPLNIQTEHTSVYSVNENQEVKSTDFYPQDMIRTEPPVPTALGYFSLDSLRQPKGFIDNLLLEVMSFFNGPVKTRLVLPYSHSNFEMHQKVRNYIRHPFKDVKNRRVYSDKGHLNEVQSFNKPSGLLLVELGYRNCALGRGAPLEGEKVLISWTKTPVRVFGGAILKTIQPFC